MNDEKIEHLIKRYRNLFEKKGLDSKKLHLIEDKLELVLPDDFKQISKVFDGYEEIAGQSFFSFDPDVKGWNVVEKTLFYRKSSCFLPRNFLALREESESFVVMETKDDPKLNTSIIECSLSDANNLIDMKFYDNPTIFPSFTDFFEYLIEQEEKDRQQK
ncbi:SMI1/KNR4 family protein [Candidatus Nucleicultrix amoebiphila]|jgi:hypothetical protein|uniref:Knr4/Smi1-like domain-containing protein n=1 Tax=Candidatus Nucleicultrix amoebiphila FS5 TaxID=1414854 RepID=A0A1W6N535_9PROT|nr:SMI1/KNR4 family protein [Candidatus Nucleicultrix amoebiphila]ARN84932.1 hypothetical protein GQ61_06135 [Candidatus Nucleicultrix amoebiphila FS5]